jgi:hypothetical protein
MSERYIPESELREAVRTILAEMLGVGGTEPTTKRVAPTKEAIALLGYKNDEQLYDAVASGLLRLGKEVEDRRKPTGQRPRYYFDIDKCRKRLAELPERRKG